MLILIWNEMFLWTQEALSANRFLYSELLKMAFVLPLYVYITVDFFRATNKWNEVVTIWTLIVIREFKLDDDKPS
jgi:hypothetical protein